jgi:hypothetical protein
MYRYLAGGGRGRSRAQGGGKVTERSRASSSSRQSRASQQQAVLPADPFETSGRCGGRSFSLLPMMGVVQQLRGAGRNFRPGRRIQRRCSLGLTRVNERGAERLVSHQRRQPQVVYPSVGSETASNGFPTLAIRCSRRYRDGLDGEVRAVLPKARVEVDDSRGAGWLAENAGWIGVK